MPEKEDPMVSQKQQYDKMTLTPIPKLIVRLGIPTIISMLITNIYNMADTYFIGQLENTSASGAIGIVFSLMAVLQAFGFMYGHGAGSIISRKLGHRDAQSASRFASTSFFLSVLTGLIIAVVGLWFLSPFMRLLGSTETILPYARDYGFYILLAAPFLTSSCVLNNILRYEGRASYAMVGLTTGGILNIALDPLFIFGLDMGVSGAGLSTALSQFVSFLILLSMFLSGKTQSRLSLRLITRDIHEVLEILAVGFPSMMRQAMNSISGLLLNHQAAIYGDAAVAAMSIVNRICSLIFAVAVGIGQGYQPVAAFNYGAGKYSRVKQGLCFALCAGEVAMGILLIVGLSFPDSIVQIFRDDPEVIRIGAYALRCQCIACLLQPVSLYASMMFQCTGKSGRATLLASLRNGVCFIPLILVLPQVIGLTGVQISQMFADILAALISLPLLLGFLRRLPPDTGSEPNAE
jgi:putative MATE family efflux protein